jgi:hypothetical protein
MAEMLIQSMSTTKNLTIVGMFLSSQKSSSYRQSSWMEGWLQGTLGKNRLLLFQDSRPLLSCSFQASL